MFSGTFIAQVLISSGLAASLFLLCTTQRTAQRRSSLVFAGGIQTALYQGHKTFRVLVHHIALPVACGRLDLIGHGRKQLDTHLAQKIGRDFAVEGVAIHHQHPFALQACKR